jgi:hypothetical protein
MNDCSIGLERAASVFKTLSASRRPVFFSSARGRAAAAEATAQLVAGDLGDLPGVRAAQPGDALGRKAAFGLQQRVERLSLLEERQQVLRLVAHEMAAVHQQGQELEVGLRAHRAAV